MLWFWFAIGLALLLLGAGILIGVSDSPSNFAFVGGVVGVLGLLVAIVFGAMLLSQHYARVSCATFARNTGRPTKFVHYTAYSWDCLTRTGSNKWIPTKNLREFGNGG